MKRFFRREVPDDLAQAHRWYEERQAGLGRDFLEAFEAVLSDIEENPRLFPVAHREIRRARITRFPYGVFYRLIEDEAFLVLAVIHLSRDPARWKERE